MLITVWIDQKKNTGIYQELEQSLIIKQNKTKQTNTSKAIQSEYIKPCSWNALLGEGF